MQQHSSTHNPEVDALWAEMERVALRLAEVSPAALVTIPLALPRDLAELLVTQAQDSGLNAARVGVACLLHGQYHAALENGLDDVARDIARLIRRSAQPQEWARFVGQHPEAGEGL